MSIPTSLDKSKIKILLLEGVHQSAVDSLESNGYSNIEYHTGSLTEEELLERIGEVHFIGIRSRTQLNAKVFAAANKLVAVGCFCIGTNQVDLPAATKKAVAVFNAPFSNTRSVAELVIAESIILLRGIAEKSAKAHRGIWQKSASGSFEIRNKTLGIIGYGSIGSQLSIMAEAMGMNVIFHDVVGKLPLGNAKQVGSLGELLAQSDIVTLHIPETGSTHNLMSSSEFSQMKAGAIFINAARGTVVDIDALCQALESKQLAGAAIDVFPVEPRSNADEFISPLRGFDNVILTPHVGGSTMEAQKSIGSEVADKLVKYSDNGSSVTSVNFPEVSLPDHTEADGVHRLLHVHHNIPGVLTQINSILSENNINISGQHLQTNDSVGYVVIDVDADCSAKALEKLSAVSGTIRSRRLF
ncbi:MAG: phosphoglycerate dehydrogenase [Pseudomonadales bacterium]|nr:phosphoglycerate dehydrogenase [Pseudomonadales bacterium]NRA14683.1 phosphoglycerate dehydrogenase [Oceanospirillaceae bacterium]